jgi:hypothetical protein
MSVEPGQYYRRTCGTLWRVVTWYPRIQEGVGEVVEMSPDKDYSKIETSGRSFGNQELYKLEPPKTKLFQDIYDKLTYGDE